MKMRFYILFALFTLLISSVSGQQTSESFPVTIEHKFGSTTFDQTPERIVVLGYTEQDTYFALGVEPIAVRYWYGDAPNGIFPWAEDAAGDAEPTVLELTWGAINYEAILELEPDFISAIDASITEEEYEALSAIAPTLAQPGDYIDYGTPWQEVMMMVGTAVGKVDEAEAIVSNLEARIESVKEANPQFENKTVAVAYNYAGQYGFYTEQDSRGRFFSNLGFVVPEELETFAGEEFYANVSEERLDLFDQDLLVFLSLSFYDGGVGAGIEEIESNPIINQLSVMQDDRILFVPEEFDDALQFSTVLSIDYLLDGLIPAITEIHPATSSTTDIICEADSRAVTDAAGTAMCVPEAPQRVITLTDGDTDSLVALGVDPVGVSNGRGSQTPPRYLLDSLSEDSISVGAFYQPNLEIVLELEPDLILFSYGDYAEPEMIEQLRTIAPVYFTAAGEDTWRDLLYGVGDAMNMSDDVDTFFEELDNRIAIMGESIDPETQFIIARWSAEGPRVMAPYIFAPAILQDLGMVMPEEIPELEEGHAHSAPLSLETVDILDSDWAFVGTLQAEGDAAEALESVFDNPLFQQLEVVQNDHVVVVDGSIWTSSGGPLAANLVLDIVEETVLGE